MRARNYILLIIGFIILFSGLNEALAQEKPPRPMAVSTLQNLSFGTFSLGSAGGDVTIDVWGGRTVTGEIIGIGSMNYCPAIFQIDAEPGTMLTWIGSDVTLSGSNGGSMNLHIQNSQNAYIASVSMTGEIRISIGGTLTVPASTPPGTYTGSFAITFIQE